MTNKRTSKKKTQTPKASTTRPKSSRRRSRSMTNENSPSPSPKSSSSKKNKLHKAKPPSSERPKKSKRSNLFAKKEKEERYNKFGRSYFEGPFAELYVHLKENPFVHHLQKAWCKRYEDYRFRGGDDPIISKMTPKQIEELNELCSISFV